MKKLLFILSVILITTSSFSQKDNYSKYHDNAVTYYTTGQYEKALVSINSALKINPSKADSYYIRGNIHQKLNNSKSALGDFQKAIDLNPNHVDALLKCGILYGKSGNKVRACFYINQACQKGSNDACTGYNKFCK